jgi:hypothetical protein
MLILSVGVYTFDELAIHAEHTIFGRSMLLDGAAVYTTLPERLAFFRSIILHMI